MRLRAVTYNVHKCRGMDGRVSANRIGGVLQELNADIIALQEVLSHQAESIARELRMQYVLGDNRQHGGYAYGNVLLSRWPIAQTRNYDLSVRGREQRGCLRADVSVNREAVLHVFNVHLGTSLFERREQAWKLIAPELLLHNDLQAPRLVMGDFNEWTTGTATKLLCSHLNSADVRKHLGHARTYPGLMPFLHLDHIYHDPALHMEKLSLHRTPKTLVSSDHLPLVAEFAWHPSSHPQG
jgi:endonuclease/exonuclease/phosphatase family metal-dependent hydrolase